MDWLARSSSCASRASCARPLGLALAGALCLLAACGDDGGSTSPGSTTTDPGTTSSPTDGGSTTAAHDGSTTGDASSTGRATSETGSTTGEVALCNGWNEDGPATPWLELYDANGRALASGGALPIQCGGQGSWMFPIFPQMGGWMLADPVVVFSVEVVVEGFPGPFGAFYEESSYIYDLECFSGGDDLEGGFSHDCIAVLPPDDVADLAQLDGAPATIHVELGVDGGEPLVIDLVDMVLSAPADVVSQDCFF